VGNGFFAPGVHSKATSLSPSPSVCIIFSQSKPRSVDDLVVNDQLSATVVDDQRSYAASAICESGLNLAIKPTLIDDSEAFLDIASLGHADDPAIRAHIKNAVLFVDWTAHALDVDAGLRIALEGALFLQLTSKEVDTQVSVLTGLWRRGDADDLAGTALEDDEIADADELARDRDGVGWEATARLDKADLLADTISDAGWATFFIFDDHIFAVMAVTAERVGDTLGGTLQATAEGGVLVLVVVVPHVVTARLVDFDVFFFDPTVFGRSTAFVLDVVGRIDAATVVTLSDVELGLEGLVSYLSAIDFDVVFSIVSVTAAIDFDVVFSIASATAAIDFDVVFSIVSATAAFNVDVDLGVFILDRLSVAEDADQHVFFSVDKPGWVRSKHRLPNQPFGVVHKQ
jgi:hypothetical protein